MALSSQITELRTFLVADIRGYTRFAQEQGDDAAARLAATFADIVREGTETRGGQVVGIRGDEVTSAFTSARQALQTAVALQARFKTEMEADPSIHLPVGIGLAAGEVMPVEEGYQGRAVALAVRLCSLAAAGEILASDGLLHLAGKTAGVETVELREMHLQGFPDPVRVSQVLAEGQGGPTAVLMDVGAAAANVLRIYLLGGFQVEIGTRTIDEGEWRLKKAATLIKLLALSQFHRLHREQAIDVLWPDLDPPAAGNNLHHALHVARRIFDPAGGSARSVRLQSELITLEWPSGIWVDVQAFEQAASHARQTGSVSAYRAAVDLYRGDLLPEDLYEDWAADRREGLRAIYHGLLVELGAILEARSDFGQAIDVLHRAVTADPTLEEAHAGLMRLYARTGQRQQALRQYEQLQHTLQEELAVEPDASTQDLYVEIQTGAIPLAPTTPVHEPPPTQEPDARRHNLPVSLTTFVGREREQRYVESLLESSRLLTLTGPGGAGKTRLALVVARDVVDRYADGVRLVELGTLLDPSLVSQAIADVLDVRERSGHDIVEAIVDRLRTREMLLILDNCEHLIDACAALAETLLSSLPRLQIFATSREPLGVPGEVTWAVPPLTIRDEHGATIDDLAASESIQLFIERARHRMPTFTLTPANAPAVSEIVSRLDGLPLAIELAAARVGVLSPEQIATRLEDALGLLTGGRRMALPHHQTLRATLDWSYDLLDSPERALFNQLSVFAGGWTLEGAEAIGARARVAGGDDVLDLLARLLDKSLVVVGGGGGERIRYRMLGPMRQYGCERLEETGEADAIRHHHAVIFLQMAEQAEKDLKGPNQLQRLNEMDVELDNIRAALVWSLEGESRPERVEIGLRIASAIWQFWHSRGHIGECRTWLKRGLERAGGLADAVRAKALCNAGFHAHQQTEIAEAITLLTESVEIYRKLGIQAGIADSLERLGDATIAVGDHERAREYHEESLTIRRALDDRWGISKSLNSISLFLLLGGHHDSAIAMLEEALSYSREMGDERGIAVTSHNIGMALIESGRFDRATAPLDEGLMIFFGQSDKRDCSFCLEALGRVAGAQGKPRRAARLFGAASVLRADVDARLSEDRVAWLQNAMAASRSAEDERSWQAAWEEGREMPLAQVVEYALSGEEEPARRASSTAEIVAAEGRLGILSPREREVAVLIAEGLTNRQIAGRLVIAERTVDTHVGKILSKLELSSRAQVATWVTERRAVVSDGH